MTQSKQSCYHPPQVFHFPGRYLVWYMYTRAKGRKPWIDCITMMHGKQMYGKKFSNHSAENTCAQNIEKYNKTILHYNFYIIVEPDWADEDYKNCLKK